MLAFVPFLWLCYNMVNLYLFIIICRRNKGGVYVVGTFNRYLDYRDSVGDCDFDFESFGNVEKGT